MLPPKKPVKKKRALKSKEKAKRLKTFNSSDFSLLEDPNLVGSISDIFKNEGLNNAVKRNALNHNSSQINFNSTINNYTSVYTVLSNSQKPEKNKSLKIIKPFVTSNGSTGMANPKRKPHSSKSKSKLNISVNGKQPKKRKAAPKQQSVQPYEIIPPSRDSLNSEIVFSTEDTQRQQPDDNKKTKLAKPIDQRIKSSQLPDKGLMETLKSSNKMLRLNIKHEYKRKNNAAIQIQKVFRGYLTRKILQKYIRAEQSKLDSLMEEYRSEVHRSQRTQRSKDFFSQHSSRTFQDEEPIDLDKVDPQKLLSRQQNSSQKESQNDYQSQGHSEQQFHRLKECSQNDAQMREERSDSSESSLEMVRYRHQQPVYGDEQIRRYLDQSDDESDEEEFKIGSSGAYLVNEDDIIFEKDEEYSESRKSSAITKNRRKSKKQGHGGLKKQSKGRFDSQDSQEVSRNSKECTVDELEEYNPQMKTLQERALARDSPKNEQNRTTSICLMPSEFETNELDLIKTSKASSNKSSSTDGQNLEVRKTFVNETGDQSASMAAQESLPKGSFKRPSSGSGAFEIIAEFNSNADSQANQQNASNSLFMETISYNEDFKSKHSIHPLGTKNPKQRKRGHQTVSEKYHNPMDSASEDETVNGVSQRSQMGVLEAKSKEQIIKERTLKSADKHGSAEKSDRTFDRNSCSSTQLEQLRQEETERWTQIINMINERIPRHSQFNQEAVEFMASIRELSFKNKEMLTRIAGENLLSEDKKPYTLTPAAEPDADICQWQNLKDSLSNSRNSFSSEADITILKPDFHSRSILYKEANYQTAGDNVSNAAKKPSFFKESTKNIKLKIGEIEEGTSLLQKNEKMHQESSRGQGIQDMVLQQMENEHIEEMLRLREEMLEKRETEKLSQLNEKLIKKQISQSEFLGTLKSLTEQFDREKLNIDRAKDDIVKGYQAALKLVKESLFDAKISGYRLHLSRSSESYKNRKSTYSILNMPPNLIIDEITSKNSLNKTFNHAHNKSDQKQQQKKSASKPSLTEEKEERIDPGELTESKQQEPSNNNPSFVSELSNSSLRQKIFGNDLKVPPNLRNFVSQLDNMSEDSSSSEIEFSEEELKRFRRTQPFDLEIADMNRNIAIGNDFVRSQCVGDERMEDPIKLHREVYEIQGGDNESHFGSQSAPEHEDTTNTDLIVEKQMEFLITEACCELLMKPIFSERLLHRKRQAMFGMSKVSDETRRQFLSIVQGLVRPETENLLKKLNQNISPLPKELLKCMRIDFSDDMEVDEEEEYEEIGKYEMILDQEICNEAIRQYQVALSRQNQFRQSQNCPGESLQDLVCEYPSIDPRAVNYIRQREKFINSRREHCEGIKWEFINMELHSLFDSWNEQIIELKTNRNGYSGIGMNELTLSMIDRNRRIGTPSQVGDFVRESKFKVMKILGFEDQIIRQLNQDLLDRNLSSSDNDRDRSEESVCRQLEKTSEKYAWVYKQSEADQEMEEYCEDAKWVYYSDEALSYGLELVYLIEEDLFGEISKWMVSSQIR